MAIKKHENELQILIEKISHIVQSAKKNIVSNINEEMLTSYWEIGNLIHKKEKDDSNQTIDVITELAQKLTIFLGKGFTRSSLTYMRQLYLKYPDGISASSYLSWSHYIELLKIDDELERGFYENQTINDKWSVRELRRQRNSALFQRLALSRDKEGILALAREGQILRNEEDIKKDPLILEFLNIPEKTRYSERELEARIIDNLQHFLLELGKGFAFIANQYRITLNNNHFYVDLVFYHRILKCFVLIDLKIGEAKHQDVGQMNMYLNYFKKEENMTDDNPPIGIILAAAKDEIMIEYATGGLSNKVFVSKYQTYLPDKALLQERVQEILDMEENEEK
ncbi:MAG: PDDEXK nuclease domain-containing protein [Chitinophagales bacterium]